MTMPALSPNRRLPRLAATVREKSAWGPGRKNFGTERPWMPMPSASKPSHGQVGRVGRKVDRLRTRTSTDAAFASAAGLGHRGDDPLVAAVDVVAEHRRAVARNAHR